MVAREPPRKRADYRHFGTITTRWGDNDAYGHVNNVVFYGWFDTCVNQYLVAQGLLDIAAGDPIGLVVESVCRYFAPLSFPGEVEVGLRLGHLGTSSATYHLGIFPPLSENPAAEGEFTHVYVNRASRRPVALPSEWREKLAALG